MNSARDTREIRPLIGGHADERAYRATWNRALLARDNWLNRQHKREAEAGAATAQFALNAARKAYYKAQTEGGGT